MDLHSTTNVQSSQPIPPTEFTAELMPASVKELKRAHRRSDDFMFLPPEDVTVLPDLNVRVRSPDYIERIRLLADAMKANGFRRDRPISCYHEIRDGVAQTIVADGHTRLEAVRLANEEGAKIVEIPVCILPRSTSMDDLLADLHVANSGTPLSMLEQAILVKRLQGRGNEDRTIAQRLQVTLTHLNSLILLAAAPSAIHQMVADGHVTGSAAIEIIRSRGPEAAIQYLRNQLEALQAQGKTKIKPAMLPEAQVRNAIKRSAPKMLERVRLVVADPGFTHLASATREALQELLTEIREVEVKNGVNASGSEEADRNQQSLDLGAAT